MRRGQTPTAQAPITPTRTTRGQVGSGRQRRRRVAPALTSTALALLLYGCAAGTLTSLAPDRTEPLAAIPPLQTVAPGASLLSFHQDRLRCAGAAEGSATCLENLGHQPLTDEQARLFLDAAEHGPGANAQRIGLALLRGDELLTGWTELFSPAPTAPAILDSIAGHDRCDGVARPLHAETIATRPGGDAILQCNDGRVLFLRLALDTPDSGHGVGWDTKGNTYSVLFGAPELVAPRLQGQLVQLLRAQAGQTGGPEIVTASGRPAMSQMAREYRRLDYRLSRIRQGTSSVPTTYADRLPSDMAETDRAKLRKNTFIQLMLPLVLVTNDMILEDRRHLLRLIADRKAGGELSPTNQQWLTRLAERYEVRANDFGSLKYRVDAVPPSLALAQAALETGWGTSRFSHEGNALFGEWTFGNSVGIVPASRGDTEDHKIRSFETLLHSVSAYMDNLNSHPAYRDFRAKRAYGRATGRPADSRQLTATLRAYGGDERYIDKLSWVISANRLDQFDDAQLAALPLFALPTPRPKPDITTTETATAGDDNLLAQMLRKVRTKLVATP